MKKKAQQRIILIKSRLYQMHLSSGSGGGARGHGPLHPG